MKRLPLLVSLPHAGLTVPELVADYITLPADEIARDGDEQAAEIYARLEEPAAAFVGTDIARAVVDVNRAPDDRRPDGVVKTHTCWNVPVYDPFPPERVVDALLDRYYHPYHQRLTEAAHEGVMLGVDCHTMAAEGPPVGPDPGQSRPAVCLSNADGTCPDAWLRGLARCFAEAFEQPVKVNDPFTGGYIVRAHAGELPWVQLELSRASFLPYDEKGRRVLDALLRWCTEHQETRLP